MLCSPEHGTASANHFIKCSLPVNSYELATHSDMTADDFRGVQRERIVNAATDVILTTINSQHKKQSTTCSIYGCNCQMK